MVLKVAGTDLNTWINDPRNHDLLRGWARVLERKHVRHTHLNHEPALCPRTLLRCQKIRKPSEEDWDSDLNCVHRVALEGVWEEWKERDWSSTAARTNTQLAVPDLVASTLYLLEMGKPDGLNWERYFDKMVDVGNILVQHAQDAEVKKASTPLRHALVKSLDEIKKSHPSDVKDIEYDRDAMLAD